VGISSGVLRMTDVSVEAQHRPGVRHNKVQLCIHVDFDTYDEIMEYCRASKQKRVPAIKDLIEWGLEAVRKEGIDK
jgi:hypothetical protein